MSGRSSRRKGSQWERDLAKLFRERGFPDAKRGIGQARSGGEVCDVEGTPFWIEAKVGVCPNPRAAMRQAAAAADDRVPVVIIKDDRCEPFMVLPLNLGVSALSCLAKANAEEERSLFRCGDD